MADLILLESFRKSGFESAGGPTPDSDLLSQRTGALDSPPAHLPEAIPATAIAVDAETSEPITIPDADRCGGLYILGKSRTGKSTLLISLALSDIESDHAVLFIDPHTDAINDLLWRIPAQRHDDIILLDPTDKDRTFGMNLLRCDNPEDPLALDNTYGRVRDVFVKVWGDQNGQLGVWLEKILRNSVYVLLENPGYTLVDIPLLLHEDTRFRNELLNNVRVNPYVKDFWYDEFDRLSKRDKTEQVGPALSRLDIFRTNTTIRHIVGQSQSTIDFYDILNGGGRPKIVLLRMPAHLSEDVKTLLGTMILSEVLHASFKRDRLSEKERRYFGLYCDEFQHFATPDFAKLFTQTGKYKVMSVVAHQTRLGQFKPGDPNQGATLNSANKVLFALNPHDARELALKFSSAPPSEARREQELVICQDPVSDLLRRPHRNSEIQAFVNKYLRPLQERYRDAREDMEGERLIRMDYLDEAGLLGTAERAAGLDRLRDSQYRLLEAREAALRQARLQTGKLYDLFDTAKNLRLTLRGLDRFCTEVMEGRRARGYESFSQFLIGLVHNFAGVEENYRDVLELYIALSYGDPNTARTIPFGLARSEGLFSEEVAALTFQAEKKTEEERRKFQTSYMSKEEQQGADWRLRQREHKIRDRQRAMDEKITRACYRSGYIRRGRTGTRDTFIRQEDFIWYPANIYTWFMWLRLLPNIEKLLIPYRTARFTNTWHGLLSDGQAAKTIAEIDEVLNLVKASWGSGSHAYMEFTRTRVARGLKGFLHRYQEGGLVMLALLDCAGKGGWRFRQDGDISLAEFPGIEGKDPVEIWCLVEKLRVSMCGALGDRRFSSLFSKYLQPILYDNDDKLYWAGFQTYVPSYPIYGDIRYRKDVQALETCANSVAEEWKKISAPVRYYLLCRAADRISFGERYSSLPPSTFARYERLVNALVSVSKDTKTRLDEAEEREEAARERQKIEKECAQQVVGISYSPPALLEPRVLSSSEMQEVRKACIKQLNQDQNTCSVAATIDEFAKFCGLLGKPENHILVPSGQYIEKQVPLRQESDMVNEMARELTGLSKYIAHARIVEEKGGEAIVWKGRIRTSKLDDVMPDAMELARAAVDKNMSGYCKPRAQIQEEIRKRQERWRQPAQEDAPPVQSEGGKQRTRPDGKGVVRMEDEPPPQEA